MTNIIDATTIARSNYSSGILPVAIPDPTDATDAVPRKIAFQDMLNRITAASAFPADPIHLAVFVFTSASSSPTTDAGSNTVSVVDIDGSTAVTSVIAGDMFVWNDVGSRWTKIKGGNTHRPLGSNSDYTDGSATAILPASVIKNADDASYLKQLAWRGGYDPFTDSNAYGPAPLSFAKESGAAQADADAIGWISSKNAIQLGLGTMDGEVYYQNALVNPEDLTVQVKMKWQQDRDNTVLFAFASNQFASGNVSNFTQGLVITLNINQPYIRARLSPGGAGQARGTTGADRFAYPGTNGVDEWTAYNDATTADSAWLHIPTTGANAKVGNGTGDSADALIVKITHHYGIVSFFIDNILFGTFDLKTTYYPFRSGQTRGDYYIIRSDTGASGTDIDANSGPSSGTFSPASPYDVRIYSLDISLGQANSTDSDFT